MSAIAPILVGDGTHTNAGFSGAASGAFTFSPSYMDSAGVMTWYVVDDQEVLDARKKFTLSVRQPAKGSQVARVTAKLVVPVMDADDSTLKIGEAIATTEFVLPKRLDGTGRRQVAALMSNLLKCGGYASDDATLQGDDNNFVMDAVTNLESPY